MAEVAYVGSKGSNLIWVGNINEVQPGPGSQASRRLIQPLSNVATINYFDPSNSSSYNSLQAKLVKRFSRGLQFLASYTFGKSLDYAGAPASGGGAVGGPQSVTLFDESRGPSGFDVKHRFVLSCVWALPFGEGHAIADSGILKPILENWQFSGIVTLSTGRPFTVFLNTGVNNGAPVLAEPDRRRAARQPDGRPVVRPRRLRGAAAPTRTGPRAAASSTRRARRRSTSRSRASSRSRPSACSSGPTPSTCSTRRSSASRTRTSARRPRAASPSTIADNRSMQFALKLDW